VRDCEWLAELLRHGLLRGSFVPARPQRELRELVRYRTALVRQRAQVTNRVQKTLEGANIKLASVATSVIGVSGPAMPAGLARGDTDPAALAQLARRRMQRKQAQLETQAGALNGRMGPHQPFLLQEQLTLVNSLDASIQRVDEEIRRHLQTHAELIERLDVIPGLGPRVIQIILAEIGPDLIRFPSAAHLASWAGLCPGNHRVLATSELVGPARATRGYERRWSKLLRRPLE
jgi:transposase